MKVCLLAEKKHLEENVFKIVAILFFLKYLLESNLIVLHESRSQKKIIVKNYAKARKTGINLI